jgi:hypothetical protein
MSPAARLKRGHPDSGSKRPTREPPAGWTVGNESTEGDERGTYVALARRWLREGGMAYRARALWSRRCRSRRRGHVRPRRAGKLRTGRRAPGRRQEGGEVGVTPSADSRDCTSTGEPCAGKAARTVCAVRRAITSLAQPGGTRGRSLGYQLTGGRKAKGTGACWDEGAAVGRRFLGRPRLTRPIG